MTQLISKAHSGKEASRILAGLSSERKDAALEAIALELEERCDFLLEQNQIDLREGEKNGLTESLLDRLALTDTRVSDMVVGVRQIAELHDPVGETLSAWKLDNGISIEKVRVPLGLVGIIYEARPNVTVDASCLCLKTGNAILLRGSSSALHSNQAIVSVIQSALGKVDIDPDVVQLVEDTNRETARKMLTLNEYLDVLIPRGGAKLIQFVVTNASVPVLETGAGNCHVYLHADAKPEMARAIVVNAKTQRPSVCNAAETLLVHADFARSHLTEIVAALVEKDVECRGCEQSLQIAPSLTPATEEDWKTEFLDYIIAVKVVKSIDEAIAHINCYGTRHSEAIVTENEQAAARFLRDVDAAAVYHNASTRFTDGFVYGFGAEIGISTQKLHARGPMGLPELTSYKYVLKGTGQIRR